MSTTIMTEEQVQGGTRTALQIHGEFPLKLSSGFVDEIPKLDAAQAGHLRHFHNLATQQDGEWHHMGSQEPGQEWIDAYRYQIATMAYAAGVCHYHRLPALRSTFKTLIEQLIHKMLLRDVWGYWFLTSHSGTFVDPSLTELRKPWEDPVRKENIMYSGHLYLMTALHAMLFGDDKYDQPDALEFRWDPVFWGMGPKRFTYTISSLQDLIVKQMEEEKWLGVCCEPNSIFVVCNQFPMIALRYEDIRKCTNVATKVVQKWFAAWEKVGLLQEDGLFVSFIRSKQSSLVKSPGIGSTAWASAFMNAWNPEFVKKSWSQTQGFLSRVEPDRVNLNTPEVAQSIRRLVRDEGAEPSAPDTVNRAREMAKSLNFPSLGFVDPTFGYVVQWASEVGDRETIGGLLNHADRFMEPTVEDGGLFYPTNADGGVDQDGNYLIMDAYTGNAAIGYARLNVANGQRKMFEAPWTKETIKAVPYVDNVCLGDNVDFLRGSWEEEKQALVLTMRTWDSRKISIEPHFRNLKAGRYAIYVNGVLEKELQVASNDEIAKVKVDVDAAEVDIVMLWGGEN